MFRQKKPSFLRGPISSLSDSPPFGISIPTQFLTLNTSLIREYEYGKTQTRKYQEKPQTIPRLKRKKLEIFFFGHVLGASCDPEMSVLVFQFQIFFSHFVALDLLYPTTYLSFWLVDIPLEKHDIIVKTCRKILVKNRMSELVCRL